MGDRSDRIRQLLPARPQPRIDIPGPPAAATASAPERGPLLTSTQLVPKRRAVRAACEPCRKRKERCNGERPTCSACTRRDTPCYYSLVGRDEAGSRSRNEALEMKNEQWRELYGLLRSLPDAEARRTLARIRDADDPITVLNFAKRVSVLADPPVPLPGPGPTDWSPRMAALNLRTLSESPIRVHARPWTAIAGDGLVSQLISSFFAWDDAFFYPFIDREAFLEDMRSGDAEQAKHCSPFLVNAICASRCFTSSRAKSFSSITGDDVGRQFFDEAKKLLDLEHGRASLPTVQGLTLLFTLSAYRGVDRAGMMYRYAAYEMLRRLHLERAFEKIKDDPEQERPRQIISKALWGLFCFESIVAYVYLDLSLLSPPTIPRCFDKNGTASDNVDLLGNLYTNACSSPPFVRGILEATCDLSELLYQSMLCNTRGRHDGNDQDIEERRQLYATVCEWSRNLPEHMRYDYNLTPQTCFLKIYTDEVLISILRPLGPETLFDRGISVKDLCIQHAGSDMAVMDRYTQSFPLHDYSCMALCGLYNTVLTVVPHLGDPRTHAIFAKAALMLRWTARDFPMAKYILQGVKAMAWAMGLAVPPPARQYLEDLGAGKDDLRDIPLAFALPPAASVRQFLSVEEGGSGVGIEMGLLLSKWSALSVE